MTSLAYVPHAPSPPREARTVKPGPTTSKRNYLDQGKLGVESGEGFYTSPTSQAASQSLPAKGLPPYRLYALVSRARSFDRLETHNVPSARCGASISLDRGPLHYVVRLRIDSDRDISQPCAPSPAIGRYNSVTVGSTT